jgi:hypothetical protein
LYWEVSFLRLIHFILSRPERSYFIERGDKTGDDKHRLTEATILAHCMNMKVASLKPLPDYRLWLRFADGTEGTVDLSEKVGRGVFASWKDPKAFAEVRVGDFGQPVWPRAIDLCADNLYPSGDRSSTDSIFSEGRTRPCLKSVGSTESPSGCISTTMRRRILCGQWR